MQNADYGHKMENLKLNFKTAYEVVRKNNKKAHEVNKKHYVRKAKKRKFEVEDNICFVLPRSLADARNLGNFGEDVTKFRRISLT